MSFPSREERATCWTARDRYWQCLDENKVEIDQSEKSTCAELRKLYHNGCPATWVKHFDRRYKYLQFKEKIEKEGYEPINKL